MIGFKFKFLIHLELIFVGNVRERCSFIVLHVAVQFLLHYLLIEGATFSPLYILASFAKVKVPIGV